MDPSQSSRSSSPLQSGSSISAAIAEEHMDDAFEVSALFVLAESLVGQGRGAGDRLCHEVEALTHGHAQLQVFHSPAPGLERATLPQALPHRYPVTFDGNTYGMLWVAPDRENPAQPAIANATARALARASGCILRLLVQASLVRVLSRDLPAEALAALTRRQCEVLQLYAQGYRDEQIVGTLCISPQTLHKHRHQIYERLGVHHFHEMLLLAYNLHMVSYLPESR